MLKINLKNRMKVQKTLLTLTVLACYLGVTPASVTAGELAATKYIDPKGFFQLVPPKGWKMQEYPRDVRGKVAFHAPSANIDLRVLVNSVDFNSVDALVSSNKEIERRTGLSTHIKKADFSGKPAVTRWFEAKGMKCSVVDFLEGSVAHNLQYCAPKKAYEKYLPVAQMSMETYEAIAHTLTDSEAKEHFLAQKRRLAQLMLNNGNLEAAMAYVKEGLAVSAEDVELLRIKKQLEGRK